MKKILLILPLLLILFGAGCQPTKIEQEISIEKPAENPIVKQGKYALDCKTTYYTGITIGGKILDQTSIRVKEGHERESLYIDGNKAKFFGSDYDVIQDDSQYLVIIRYYSLSGLTEVVSINKGSGIGFDTKTLSLSISGAPNTDTYILSCIEI